MDVTTVASSVVSSVAAKLVFHPVDTIRTLNQTTGGPYLLPIHRYWAGLLPSIGLSVPGFTAYLVAYRQTKSWLSPSMGPSSLGNYIVSGAVAELASSGIWTPTEVLKGRMQIATKSDSTWTVVKSIFREEGMRGFFHGYWMGLTVFLPYSVAWWVTYEHLRLKLAEYRNAASAAQLQPYEHAGCAGVATLVAATATNFLDVVKTRQQLAHSPEVAQMRPDDKRGVVVIARNLVRENGLMRSLVRGLGVRLLCSVPSSALAMAIMETLHPDPSLAVLQED